MRNTASSAAAPSEDASIFVAGVEEGLQALRELIIWPMRYEQEAHSLGLKWPKGLLLHGPPGTGKSLLVRSVARECGASLHTLSASSVFGAYAGESERRLRDAFSEAAESAARSAMGAAIIFIDEIDALCPRRDARRQQETRVVAQLLTLMDGINSAVPVRQGRVLVVAATNRPNAIDPALRRPGRFDREIAVPVPNAKDRAQILMLHARGLPLLPSVDLGIIANECQGYVGADLAALCREAAMSAMRAHNAHGAQGRVRSSLTLTQTEGGPPGGKGRGNETWSLGRSVGGQNSLQRITEVTDGGVGMEDFRVAMGKVGPSVVRGSTAEVPAVSWDEVGGLHDVKRRLQKAVEWPIRHAHAFQRLGLAPPRGVLLHGPPGCSKTTLARAAAHAARATLFSLSGAELFSMYVGEGEGHLREAFRRARLAAPSIVFLDEADAIAARRSEASEGGGSSSPAERLLASLLTEMDGLDYATGVLVLAATNRPQAIDPAILRPGRFDVVLYVPPPDRDGRLEALQVHTRHMTLAADVDLAEIATSTELFTGAELAGLCGEAAMAALRESLIAVEVKHRHFQAARGTMSPSLTRLGLQAYEAFGDSARSALQRGKGS